MGRIPIPAHAAVTIPVKISKSYVALEGVTTMVNATKKCKLSKEIEVTPTILASQTLDNKSILNVELINRGFTSEWILSEALVAELQEVKVVDSVDSECKGETNTCSKAEFLKQFTLDETILSVEERKQVCELLFEFEDIFSKDEFDIGHTDRLQHKNSPY